MKKFIDIAWSDILGAVKNIGLAGTLGWQDVKQRYRRSKLGPFWLTISMGVLVGTLGIVFGGIFKSNMTEFLPFLAIGFMMWTYFSTVINEGCTAFSGSDALIKQLSLPMSLYIFRVVWRNIIILIHNSAIIPIVFLVYMRPLQWVAMLAIVGLILNTLLVTWVALVVGVICTRYRDLPQIIASVLQIAFYTTPIVWFPNQLEGTKRGLLLLDMNPFYHMMEIVRAPLMGYIPSLISWCVTAGIVVVGWVVAMFVLGKYRRRISYWL